MPSVIDLIDMVASNLPSTPPFTETSRPFTATLVFDFCPLPFAQFACQAQSIALPAVAAVVQLYPRRLGPEIDEMSHSR